MLSGTIPKSNRNIVETERKPISLDTHVRRRLLDTHVRHRSLLWIGTCTSVKSGEIKLILWPQLSHLVK
jgi:hypothetical protein